MTLTDQLAAALRPFAAEHDYWKNDPPEKLCLSDGEHTNSPADIPWAAIVQAHTALAAYDARPAASDDVERVARALARKARVSEMEASGFNFRHLSEYVDACWADHKDRARAAIAAMPPLKIRIGKFVLRHAPNGIWIGRADGEGGEFATEDVERVIAQFYKEQF